MRWVTTFAGSRDRWQVPVALLEADLLERHVTEFYAPLDRTLGRSLLRIIPGGARDLLGRRFLPSLPSGMVEWSAMGLTLDLLFRRTFARSDARLGAQAARVAKRSRAGLLAYSYYAYRAFTEMAEAGLPKVLFQVHPHPRSVRRILDSEIQHHPESRDTVITEPDYDDERYDELCAEPALADRILVASRFTASTLTENGIDPSRITVVPYGADAGAFYPDGRPTPEVFQVCFVGQMVPRKGLRDLLEAWRALRLPNARLVVAGRGRHDPGLLHEFAGLAEFQFNISRDELRRLYSTSDVFCLPSLVEGFGLVYLEALACGAPVIGTANTGAADIVTEGTDGFIVPPADPDALGQRLLWCYENRSRVAAMREDALALALKSNWESFRHGVRKAVQSWYPV